MTTIIKKDRVEVRAPTPEELAAARNGRAKGEGKTCEAVEKSLRLSSDRGVVLALELTCSCGEVTVVELEYPGDELPSEPPSEEA